MDQLKLVCKLFSVDRRAIRFVKKIVLSVWQLKLRTLLEA